MAQRASSADLAQLESVYRDNVRRVYGYAVNRLGPDDAADVVSEVFHAAAVATRSGQVEQVTASWLMAVTRNKIMDHWRRAYRRKSRRHLTDARSTDLVEFPNDWAHDARRSEVLAALDRLSQKDRTLLILHHVDGLRIADLAEITGMSQSALESALARARRAFRRNYSREDGR